MIDGVKDIEIIDVSILDVFPLESDGNKEKYLQYAELLWDYVEKFDIDPKSWLFQVQCDNLPSASWNWLRETDPSVYFAPWQYEHGSEWIMPYVKEIPLDK